VGQRKFPPLTPREIIEILLARGFIFSHTKGDHRFYMHMVKGRACLAQVDMGCTAYGDDLIKKVLAETNMTREQFYCSTKSTAKKINGRCASDEELKAWAVAD